MMELNYNQLPAKIRVGAIWYALEVIHTDTLTEHSPLGITNNDTAKIVVRLVNDDSQNVNTLVHELMHAVFCVQDLAKEWHREEERFSEEVIVTRITNGFLALLYDNPLLNFWLTKATGVVGNYQSPSIDEWQTPSGFSYTPTASSKGSSN